MQVASEPTRGTLVDGIQGMAAEGSYYGGNCQIEQKCMAGINSAHVCYARSELQSREPVRPMIHLLRVGTGVARRSFVNRAPQTGQICDRAGAEGGQCRGGTVAGKVQRWKEWHVVGMRRAPSGTFSTCCRELLAFFCQISGFSTVPSSAFTKGPLGGAIEGSITFGKTRGRKGFV